MKTKFYFLLWLSFIFLILDIITGQIGYSTTSFIFSICGVVSWLSLLYYGKKYIDNYNPSIIDLILGLIDVVVGVLLFIEYGAGFNLIAQIFIKSLLFVRIIKVARAYKGALKIYIVARGSNYVIGRRKMEEIEKTESTVVYTNKTISTTIQKVLVTIMAIFGTGGIVAGSLPSFTSIAADITTYIMMASEIIAVIAGVIYSNTSDKVLTEEDVNETTSNSKELKAARKLIAEAKAEKDEAAAKLAKIEAAEELVAKVDATV